MSRRIPNIEQRHEIKTGDQIVDPRTLATKFAEWLGQFPNLASVTLPVAILTAAMPVLAVGTVPFLLFCVITHVTTKSVLPVRYPMGFKDDKGKVIAAYPRQDKVLVEGVNRVKKHTRVSQNQRGAQSGGIVTQEAPINVSNVMVVDSDGKPTRVGYRFAAEGPDLFHHLISSSRRLAITMGAATKVIDHDLGTLPGQAQRVLASDAAAASIRLSSCASAAPLPTMKRVRS